MLQKTSRRNLLKRTVIILGAVALIQPIGVVQGFAQETPKKEDVKKQPGATSGTTKAHNGTTKHGTSKKGTGKKGSSKKKGSTKSGKTTPTPNAPKKEA